MWRHGREDGEREVEEDKHNSNDNDNNKADLHENNETSATCTDFSIDHIAARKILAK